MRKICFTIDVERDGGKKSYLGVTRDLKAFAKFCEGKGMRTTMYVTSDCLERYPKLFKEFAKQGHEIALHGHLHERWDILGLKEKEERLGKAIRVYRKVFKGEPKGFRAPQFSADFELVKLLEKRGFDYDSSIVQCPVSQAIFFPSRFSLYARQCLFRMKLRKSKIDEIPVSSFGLPISIFALGKLPFWIFKIIFSLSSWMRKDKTIVMLSHSYELNGERLAKLKKFFGSNENDVFITMEEARKLREGYRK